jgi:hypothetical protein
MASNKLFEAHEKARTAAESAAKKYSEFLKDAGKSREPDNEGTRSKQIGRVQREIKKGVK